VVACEVITRILEFDYEQVAKPSQWRSVPILIGSILWFGPEPSGMILPDEARNAQKSLGHLCEAVAEGVDD